MTFSTPSVCAAKSCAANISIYYRRHSVCELSELSEANLLLFFALFILPVMDMEGFFCCFCAVLKIFSYLSLFSSWKLKLNYFSWNPHFNHWHSHTTLSYKWKDKSWMQRWFQVLHPDFNKFIFVFCAAEISDYRQRVLGIKELVNKLPKPNHDTMQALFKHLRK